LKLENAKATAKPEAENASLSSRLSAYRDKSRELRPDIAKAYDDLVRRLETLDAGAVGPATGSIMPPFSLPDETGTMVSLNELLRRGPVVVSFNRGHWCPYCKLELRTLAASYDRIRWLGASVVSIMPDRAQFTADYVEKMELPFPVLSDIDLGYAMSLGLIFWVGEEVERLYKSVGVDLDKYQGCNGFFLPMAAKFIVGRDGRVTARQVNLEFRERMEPQAIIGALAELRVKG
jgi:peroxiredoxin